MNTKTDTFNEAVKLLNILRNFDHPLHEQVASAVTVSQLESLLKAEIIWKTN